MYLWEKYLNFIKCIYGGGAYDKKKEEEFTTKVNTMVLMTDNFFLNIKVLVAKVLKKKVLVTWSPHKCNFVKIKKQIPWNLW